MKKLTSLYSTDFQVHTQIIYKKKSKPKKVFNYVISGFLIATTLVSSLNLKGISASSQDNKVMSNDVVYSNEFVDSNSLNSMYHLNLKNAVKVLDSAIKNNQLDNMFFDNVTKELDKISAFIDEKPSLKLDVELNETIKFTERVLKQEMRLSSYLAVSRSESINALEIVQNKMGIEDRLEDLAWVVADNKDKKLGDSILIEGVKDTISGVIDVFKPMEVEASSVGYHDLKPNHPYYKQYQWAIANGYIRINRNAVVNKKKVTLVSPNALLTEADALMGITKYFWGKEVAKTKPANKKNWASVYYQVAQRKKLPIKSNYKSKTSPQLTKGQLAVLLISAHYGKPVSLDTAIQKMYESGITNGNKVGSGFPKTKASFGVNDKVSKTTYVLWLNNYHLNKGKIDKKQQTPVKNNVGSNTVPDKYKGMIKVGDIYTHYGRTYQTRTQQEYDKAFGIIKTRVDQLNKEGWFTKPDNTVYQAYWLYYKEGKRPSDYPEGHVLNWALGFVEQDESYKNLIQKGFTVEELLTLAKISELAFALEAEAGARDPGNGKPRSIYDSLVNGQYDCDTTANVMMAIADIMGYDSLILASPTHADSYIKFKGEWFSGANLMTDMILKSLEQGTHYLYTPPKTGLK